MKSVERAFRNIPAWRELVPRREIGQHDRQQFMWHAFHDAWPSAATMKCRVHRPCGHGALALRRIRQSLGDRRRVNNKLSALWASCRLGTHQYWTTCHDPSSVSPRRFLATDNHDVGACGTRGHWKAGGVEFPRKPTLSLFIRQSVAITDPLDRGWSGNRYGLHNWPCS